MKDPPLFFSVSHIIKPFNTKLIYGVRYRELNYFLLKTLGMKECEQLEHSLATYRGIYACGFERYHKLNVGIVPLWRAMIAAAEDRGEFYSEAMISSYAAQGGKAAP